MDIEWESRRSPERVSMELPLLVALKKDPVTSEKKPGRVCIDPRALNSLLQPDRYPLPLVSEIFQFLARKSVFSAIDLEQAFLQLPVNEPDKQKLAFTWAVWHLMFAGTPFGVIPTSSVLQRTMQRVLEGSQCAVAFLDDIAIGSASPAEHLEDLVDTLDRLTRVNLRISIIKSHSFRRSLHLLGHTFSAEGIAVDRRKPSMSKPGPYRRLGTRWRNTLD